MVEVQRNQPPGPGRRVTIADIARDLGISKAAVSYALNGQPGVGCRHPTAGARHRRGDGVVPQQQRPGR